MEKPTKKYETLIMTAYQQFALHGYEKTTIDDILKVSGISKGLFYHHFANKNELFVSLYTQAAKEITEKTLEIFESENMDLTSFAKKYMQMQFSLSKKTPYLFTFLKRAESEKIGDIQEILKHVLVHRHRLIMERLDWHCLQKGVTKEQAISLVTWVAEGFTNEVLEKRGFFAEEDYPTFCAYLDIMSESILEKRGE